MTRLSIITTRTGDDGTTGLADGTRLCKTAPRIATLGDIDELNSHIGLLRTESLDHNIDTLLSKIQHDLFDMGAEICLPGHKALNEDRVIYLDTAIKAYNSQLDPLKEFILPGGTRAAATAHLARTVCRRAERQLIGLFKQIEQNGNETPNLSNVAAQYLNRLSDLLFVLARVINKQANHSDVLWNASK